MNIVVDTGFWFALFNKNDQYHNIALNIEPDLEQHALLIPWSTLYETINTKCVASNQCRQGIKGYLDKNNSSKINDLTYRDEAIDAVINPKLRRNLSLVDYSIRCILEDPNIKTDALITFNPSDFSDVCRHQNIEIIPC